MTKKQVRPILVVDDDQAIVKVVSKLLSEEGFDIVTSSNGLDAMEQVKAHNPQLIVLDIMMPEVNGYDVCRNLKFDSPYKNIPILLLTSRDQEIDPRIGQMMGIEYLQKPIDAKAFVAKVKKILK